MRQLEAAIQSIRTEGRGSFVVMRGRRQVGKSRLVTQFLSGSGVPSVYYQCTRKGGERELAAFTAAVAASSLLCAPAVRNGVRFSGWGSAFATIAESASRRQPAIVVIDELPYLVGDDPDFEATLQKSWDHDLERNPVLLILVGSDLAMMSALCAYERPLYGRITKEMVVQPLNPSEVGDLRGLNAAEAFDAKLVTGGFPRVALSWPKGASMRNFIKQAFADPSAPLTVVGERMLAAEFPADAQARTVLAAIGSGDCTFTSIANVCGLGATSLQRSLEILQAKDVVVKERALSIPSSQKNDRYRVSDPYLNFWLRFVEPSLGDIERAKGDLAEQRLWAAWDSYRGKAIEPIVRQAIERLLPDPRMGDARRLGSYWTRTNDVEVDVVGVSGDEKAKRIELVGSVKWRQRELFSSPDVGRLLAQASLVPGTGPFTLAIGVSRTGFSKEAKDLLHATLEPEDLLNAWRTPDARIAQAGGAVAKRRGLR